MDKMSTLISKANKEITLYKHKYLSCEANVRWPKMLNCKVTSEFLP